MWFKINVKNRFPPSDPAAAHFIGRRMYVHVYKKANPRGRGNVSEMIPINLSHFRTPSLNVTWLNSEDDCQRLLDAFGFFHLQKNMSALIVKRIDFWEIHVIESQILFFFFFTLYCNLKIKVYPEIAWKLGAEI